MRVHTSDYFDQRFEKLSPKIKKRFFERLTLFLSNPHHPLLRNHTLKGDMTGLRAFSVTGDFRVLYRILNPEAIKLLDIGTHNQVY